MEEVLSAGAALRVSTMILSYFPSGLEKARKAYGAILVAYPAVLAPCAYLAWVTRPAGSPLSGPWAALGLYGAVLALLEAGTWLAGRRALAYFEGSSIELSDDHLVLRGGGRARRVDFAELKGMDVRFLPDGSVHSLRLARPGGRMLLSGYQGLDHVVAAVTARDWEDAPLEGGRPGPHLRESEPAPLPILAGGLVAACAAFGLERLPYGRLVGMPLLLAGLGLYLALSRPLPSLLGPGAQRALGGLLVAGAALELALALWM